MDLERSLQPTGPLEKIVRKLNPDEDNNAKAAVGILFREDQGELEFLLVKRAEVQGDPWSGDMAFPGGKKCPDDRNLLETVMREVMEETNIHLEPSQYLGSMDPLISAVRPSMAVTPMVFRLYDVPEIRINEELSYHVWTRFSNLQGSKGHALVKNRYDTDVFYVGDDVVWGLTFRMLERLLRLVEED
jgi:8-oxo-dGTP pyrophosphatase MutT (NUDIX family)